MVNSVQMGISPSSYHTTDERDSSPIRFWYRSDWSVLDTIESLVEGCTSLGHRHFVRGRSTKASLVLRIWWPFSTSSLEEATSYPPHPPVHIETMMSFVKGTKASVAIVVDTVVKSHWFETVRFDDTSEVISVGDEFIITLCQGIHLLDTIYRLEERSSLWHL